MEEIRVAKGKEIRGRRERADLEINMTRIDRAGARFNALSVCINLFTSFVRSRVSYWYQ